ncbi:PREDICTED: trafficking protein particle complex subunit 10-like isoform X2 [Priapulus caudatus]|uniref:Trafficking protein particle complex subunit 10-like isoform X2 n=1 Tax=Priapulus caudatus TaxID=37621 RepID=A0ABM1ED52_PRICU|nr:PREDICTED: trafficking protein particle complex subunit 10-like isoform X2 [Priapulus caudatus]
MEDKPVVTHAGDAALFLALHAGLAGALPREQVEWRRSYGRAPKTVLLDANFVQFSEDILPKHPEVALLGQPVFHTYWTECNDVDAYKAAVKEEITTWQASLKNYGITDWLIVAVVNTESKKGKKPNILPRTSVVDKIKSDFCSKQNDRCFVLFEPFKSDVKSAESWQTLLQRLRQLILHGLNRYLSRFEENMRSQREKRTVPGWSFCNYFMLQEELAFVFQMLGQYEDALVQYDELDALFTQYVVNYSAGDTTEWMATFMRPCICWDGLSLAVETNDGRRAAIQHATAHLLDFRNYLFSRQCALLLTLRRPWEVAQRSLPFMHNCVNELNLLEIAMPKGSVYCWVFLSCLEVLDKCESASHLTEFESYSLYTASLWNYARLKLHALGELCGLMPGTESSSEQLNMVVDLLSGMGQTESGNSKKPGPMDKLREALSSEESFRKHYLELSELAMGTFKHIGRLRSARLIGKDLAVFYMKLGELYMAENYLQEALKMYKKEGWESMVADTRMELAKCQLQQGNYYKYVKTCAHLASSLMLPADTRQEYYDELITTVRTLDIVRMKAERIFELTSAEVAPATAVTLGDTVTVTLHVTNNLPSGVLCNIACSLRHTPRDRSDDDSGGSSNQMRSASESSLGSAGCGSDAASATGSKHAAGATRGSRRLRIQETIDRVTGTVYVSCRNSSVVLQRMDSVPSLTFRDAEVAKEDFSHCLCATAVMLKPGANAVPLQAKTEKRGSYALRQACIEMASMEFLQWLHLPVSYDVVCEEPTVFLTPDSDMLAGLPQHLDLVLNSGSHGIEDGVVIKMMSSAGLSLQVESGAVTILDQKETSMMLKLPGVAAFETLAIAMTAVADLAFSRSQKIMLYCPWSDSAPYELCVSLLSPFTVSHSLHTTGKRKFVQVVIHGECGERFSFERPSLAATATTTDGRAVDFTDLNIAGQVAVVSKDQNLSYIWSLEDESIEEVDNLELVFSVTYKWLSSKIEECSPRQCGYHFTLANFKTFYSVTSHVEPVSGTAFCRAGHMCRLHVDISMVTETTNVSLMYEVIADQTMWAVCGRTAGVVTISDAGQHQVSLDVMPLVGGYLPLPEVKLSKYIKAERTGSGDSGKAPSSPVDGLNPSSPILASTPRVGTSAKSSPVHLPVPRLEGFSSGQVYNRSQALQVHVLPASNTSLLETST